MNYKFGICSWCVPATDLYEKLELLHELGLDSMELDVDFDKANPLLSPGFCEKFLQKADEYGISFNSTALNAIGKCVKDGTIEEFIDMVIKIAVNMKLTILQVPAFGDISLEDSERFDKTVVLYQKICDQIAEHDLILGTENTLGAQGNLELVEKVNRDNFKVYFDTQNPHLLHGIDMADMYDKLAEKICEIHIKDGDGDYGNSLLGGGSANFLATVSAIKNSEYKGNLHIETVYKLLTSDKKEQIELLKKDIATAKKVFS